ncbi:hypothetical protein PR048_003103 [Dryococelus australis]|uniref:Uncharacterized protein n=1 Tax=Dryococelus australis TaxID=614101 RepID=A0ABQ9IM18_9NEOP|nr:hypothetical protein PR048_003103 [Dryococelus australis]
MAQDVEKKLSKIKRDKRFAIKIDLSTDISNDAQLIVYVSYFDASKGIITDDILGCKQLAQHTSGDVIFETLDNFFKASVRFTVEMVSQYSMDGVAAMTAYESGLVACIGTVNLDINWQHCIIHKQSLAAKNMTGQFNKVPSIKFLSFNNMCEEIGSTHTKLLLHTDVQWVLRGWVLALLFVEGISKDKTPDWITNPFDIITATSSKLPIKMKEDLLTMSANSISKATFKQLSLCDLWTAARQELKENKRHCYFVASSISIYLCEQFFSALTSIKSNLRNCMNPEPGLILALTHSSLD